MGEVPGQSLVHKYGRNHALPNGSWAGINELQQAFPFLTAATTLRVKAGGDAADTAAGLGAQTIFIQGIGDDGYLQSETITLAGASASSNTANSYWRIFRAYVETVGTYGAANTGNIIIENSGGGTDLIQITAGEGQSQFGAYSVPKGKTVLLSSVITTLSGAKTADIRACYRLNFTTVTGAMSPTRVGAYFEGLSGLNNITHHFAGWRLPEFTDIWFDGNGAGAGVGCAINFEMILVDTA